MNKLKSSTVLIIAHCCIYVPPVMAEITLEMDRDLVIGQDSSVVPISTVGWETHNIRWVPEKSMCAPHTR